MTMKSIGTSTQTNRRRLFSRAAATLLALGVANVADAQPSGASDVKLKKPDPMIYNMAQQQIGIPKERFNTSLNLKPRAHTHRERETYTSNNLMLL
jgi:beta-phosphoglucomutase-like phosphatase (HAD superfamily)